MKKLTNEDLGTLLTREMMQMMLDGSIPHEIRSKLFCAIAGDEKFNDPMMDAFVNSLKVGFIRINNKRILAIEARRKRQKEYAKHLRTSMEINVDEHTSTNEKVDERASLGIAMHSKAVQNNNIPHNPPEGEGRVPSAITIEEVMSMGSPAASVEEMADEIERSYPKKVNRKKLTRALASVLKKNGAAEIMDGFRKHLANWAKQDFVFAPGRITDWLYDGKYLEPVFQKKNGAAEDSVGSGCGNCGVDIA